MEFSLNLINKSSSVKDLCKTLSWAYGGFASRYEKFSEEEKGAVLFLKIRGRSVYKTRHSFDEQFFFEDSPDFYYFLGFFVGDGCISANRRGQKRLTLMSTDRDIMEGYRARIKSTYKLFVSVRDRRKDCFRLTITSNKVCNRLMSLGVPLNKSYSDGWKIKVPDEYMNYYLRGLCDSDGSIFRNARGDKSLGFCSSSLLEMERVLKYIKFNIFPVRNRVSKAVNIWKLSFSSKAVAQLIFRVIYYPELSWDMKRKRLKGNEILGGYKWQQ